MYKKEEDMRGGRQDDKIKIDFTLIILIILASIVCYLEYFL